MIKSLGNSVYQLTYNVPEMKAVPPVNGFLILADMPILIDGGTSDDRTFQALKDDLTTLKLKPSDIGQVLLTHNHADHIGMPSRLASENKKLKVFVHEEEWVQVTASDRERERLRDVLCEIIVSWGVDPEIVAMMREKIIQALRFGGGIGRDQILPYPKKDLLKVGGLDFQAIHCPGHTEGLVCLWWPAAQSLFSNDHVLETISPNPTLYLNGRNGKICGLGDYLNSLSNVEKLPAKLVMPGHGAPFTNLTGSIEKIRTNAKDRQKAILQNLTATDGEPLSIIELTQKIWGEMDPLHIFLGAREVHGFLEMLEEDGLVKYETVGHTKKYSRLKKAENLDIQFEQFQS